MKKAIYLQVLIPLVCLHLHAQNFTWMRGSNTSSITGNYGTMNVPSGANDPGGRHGCATWTDASGNLWLFGGEGYSATFPMSWLNDLWKYNPTTNQWTWIRGSSGPNALSVYGTQNVSSPTNEPGAREFAMSWTDASGNFWLYGGDGFASTSTFGRLGDLWKYNPGTNQWTWVKGFTTVDQTGVYGTQNVATASNLPGGRHWGAVWTSGSNVYVFGGRGYGASNAFGYLGDFWMYNMSSNNWTWLGGAQTLFPNGTYGTQGTPSTANLPGGRAYPATWTDASGNFFLFGGLGCGASTGPSFLNDLWKFDPGNGSWVWLNGSNNVGQKGSYNFRCVESSGTVPGGRFAPASWRDLEGNLWLFGGQGYDSTNFTSYLNDLFRYNPLTNRWTWMKGSKTAYQNGTYGTMGVPGPNNMPGSRLFNTCWRGINSKFWLLGGEGLDVSSTVVDNMNDLWYYIPPCNPDSIISQPGNLICSGASVTLTAFNQCSCSVLWYNSPTGTTAIGGGNVLTFGPLSAGSTLSTITYYASSNGCTVAPRALLTVSVMPLPTLSITGASSVCLGSAASLTVAGGSSYTWSPGGTGNSKNYVPTTTPVFTYSVTGTDAFGCSSSSTNTLTVYALPALTITSTSTLICKGHPVTLTAAGASSYNWSTGSNTASTTVTPTISTGQGSVNYTVTGTDANGCSKTQVVPQAVSACLGLGTISSDLSFVLFPNPTSGAFTIHLESSTSSFITLYNAMGQKVFEQHVSGTTTEIKPNLPAGVYFYLIEQGHQKTGGKLVVE